MTQEQDIFEIPKGPNKELRVLGTACYTPFGFVLPYMLEKSHVPFVLFHLRQGLAYFGVFLLASFFPVDGTFGIAVFAYLLMGAWTGYHAYNGEQYSPIVVTLIKNLVSKFSK